MNHITRLRLGGRLPPLPGRIRHSYRTMQIAPFGLVDVSWWVAAGLSVGVIFMMPNGLKIIPLQPQHFKDYETLHSYSGPRPYSFYFYCNLEDIS